MENIGEYKIKELKVENDPKMKFIVKLNILNNEIIVEGYYKIKFEGNNTYKLIVSDRYIFTNEETNDFNTIIRNLYIKIKEKIILLEGIEELFLNVDGVNIPDVDV